MPELKEILKKVKKGHELRLVLKPNLTESAARGILSRQNFDFEWDWKNAKKLLDYVETPGPKEPLIMTLHARKAITDLVWYENILGDYIASAEDASSD